MILGRPDCGRWEEAIRHEWLVTNNLGGYACGTVAGAHTRRYHGFLMASFEPPAQRTLLVSKLDATVEYGDLRVPLSANEFGGGAVDPHGFTHLESFAVIDGVPTWRYAVADALLEQRVFMAPFANTTYLRLELLRATLPMKLVLQPLVTYRDYHAQERGARPFAVTNADVAACRIRAFAGARPITLSASTGTFETAPDWYWNFLHREEAARGLDALEDLWRPGAFRVDLAVAQAWYLTATAETADAAAGPPVLAALATRSRRVTAGLPASAPPWIRALAVASNQFIVRRGRGPDGAGSRGAREGGDAHGDSSSSAGGTASEAPPPRRGAEYSIIAGYPWFADWGRDTMIALPGLATALGRFEVTAEILRTYARYVDRGMLPNRFPDAGGPVEYNTADATWWMFHALDDYLAARPDPELAAELFPTLEGIVRAHLDGTRFGIKVDPVDGLLAAGEPGTQLTWMDAKFGDQAFTPRVGKAVEINALWFNALDLMVRLSAALRGAGEAAFYRDLLERCGAGFGRFWNAAAGCLYDVVDVDGGTGCDAAVRPNQIIAVALPRCALASAQMRAVVDTCARDLLTSYGLRSLSPRHRDYVGRYGGDQRQRDAAYHQGTVWAWLLGPFARAHFRVYRDRSRAQSFLEPMAQHLGDAGMGSISEIFDGDAPHAARGCFAQAWSVGEVLGTWIQLERAAAP